MTSSSRISPTDAAKRIRYEDGSFYRFPEWRWSFSHWRELQPTIEIPRGEYPVWDLPRAERDDLDAVTFLPLEAIRRMTLGRIARRQLYRMASSSCIVAA
jgi:hypothetical protein